VLRHVDDHEARAGEEGDPHGIERYTRRKNGRKPRLGQKREAQRVVLRQSVVITGIPFSWAQRMTCAVSARPTPVPRASGSVDAWARSMLLFGTRKSGGRR